MARTLTASLCRITSFAALSRPLPCSVQMRSPARAIISESQFHFPVREKLAHLGQGPALALGNRAVGKEEGLVVVSDGLTVCGECSQV